MPIQHAKLMILAGVMMISTGAAPAAPNKCKGAEKLLMGSWSFVELRKNGTAKPREAGDPEMTFEKEDGKNIYRSYLHSRPDVWGEWRLQGCQLSVISQEGSWVDKYQITLISKKMLKLTSDLGDKTAYQRFK